MGGDFDVVDALAGLAEDLRSEGDFVARIHDVVARMKKDRDEAQAEVVRLERERRAEQAEAARLRDALAMISLTEYESTSSASEKVHDHARIARKALYGEKTGASRD